MKELQEIDSTLIQHLQTGIHYAVKILAVLMTVVILMGVIDVAWTIFQKFTSAPIYILTVNDMLATFGSFMAVLIAIEIFVNITIYLRDDIIHVRIVMATALMAVSRKVIILDLKVVEPAEIYGLAALVFALGIAYFLVRKLPPFKLFSPKDKQEQLEAEENDDDRELPISLDDANKPSSNK